MIILPFMNGLIKTHKPVNPVRPIMPVFLFKNKNGSLEKIPLSAASISRYTIGCYLRLHVKYLLRK